MAKLAPVRLQPADDDARRLAALEAIFRLLATEHDEEAALRELCALLIKHRDYGLAFIGRAMPDHRVAIIAAVGPFAGYMDEMKLRWDDGPSGRGPAGRCIREQIPVVLDTSDPNFAPWKARTEAFGFRSFLAIPFLFQDGSRGILDVGSASPATHLQKDESFLRLVAGILGMRELLSAEGGRAARDLARREGLEKRLRLLLENFPAVLFVFDKDAKLKDALGAGLAKFGLTPDQVIGQSINALVGTNDPRDYRLRNIARALAGERVTAVGEFLGRQLQTFLEPIFDDDGKVDGVLGVALDISDRVQAEEAVRKSEQVLERAEEMAHFGSWRHDFITDEVVWSKELFRILGLEPDSVVPTKDLFYAFDFDEDRELIKRVADLSLQNHSPYIFDHRIRRKDGEVRWVQEQGEFFFGADGAAIGHSGTLLDITDRKQAEERLAYLAHHDALTDLPNRVLLADRLTQSLAHAKRHGNHTAVMFVDIDRFKHINDSLGHTLGDFVLKRVGHAVRAAVREGDTVARPGGDEYVIVLDEIARLEDITEVGQKVMRALSEPIEVENRSLFVTASMGVALFPDDGDDAETLMRRADTAMYKAKEAGGNRIQFFTAQMHRAAMERIELQAGLRAALANGELSLAYQPIVDMRGAVVEVEALARWRHPKRGDVPPNEFIPIAEDTGLIVPIGEWVLHQACEQMKRWLDAGAKPMRISVNLSARQFEHSQIVDTVRKVLAQTGLPPQHLGLEITESAILRNMDQAISMIAPLKTLGVRIAIDDFGSGHSGLYYLKRLKVDTVKLDRAYIDGLPDDVEDVAIAEAVIALGHALKMNVIAEGVETEKQRQFLESRGCDAFQGYLVMRPAPAESLSKFLGSNVADRATRGLIPLIG